jgi:ubiquinol-cytochrome c reductase core subunit 2
MALQPHLTTYFRKISINNVRCFAAAAKPKESAASSASGGSTLNSHLIPPEEVQTTSVHNVTVSTQETNRPLAKIAVYYKAGSRYENDDNLGVVHALRMAAGIGTSGATKFGIARTVEANGGILTCTAGREHIAYTIEATRDRIVNLQQILIDLASKQNFRPWEVEETLPRLKAERITLAPEIRVLELLHKAAFRKGLGYSLYSPKSRVGKNNHDVLDKFVAANFVEASVVGLGVEHAFAEKIAKRLKVEPKAREVQPSKFYSHEIRKDLAGDLAYVAVATHGAGFANPKETVAAALAQRALGNGTRTKRGNTAGKLAAAVSDGSAATAINLNYSDAGLLGVLVVGTSSTIGGATKRAVDTLRSVSLTDADISRAKSMLRSDIAFALESDAELVDDIGIQSLFNGSVSSQDEIAKLIDSVSAADVNNLLKKGGGKLSLAAIGNISKLPYLDEL